MPVHALKPGSHRKLFSSLESDVATSGGIPTSHKFKGGVPVGTIKSRVNRDRIRLAKLLQKKHRAEIGPDCLTKAALQTAVRS